MRTETSLRAAGDTHPGLQRSENEDRFHYDPSRGIFLVVDGVGGHAAGEQAADTAVTMLRARLERETGPIDDRIREAITIANNEIHRRASLRPEWKGMGCVLTVAVVDNGNVTVGHVGDTRLYKLRRGEIVKVTRDHSPVGEREDAHQLSEAEAMRHPRRNEVYRDVGAEPHETTDPEFIDILKVPFEPDSALLLCSDGLTDVVSSTAIGRVVEEYAGHPYEVVRALIDAANDGGGKDNVTVVYVENQRFANTITPQTRPAAPVQPTRTSPEPTVVSEPAPHPSKRWVVALITAVLLIVAGAAAWRLGVRLPWKLPELDLMRTTIVVSPTDSISSAIVRARVGAEVIVEPGEYRERLRLKSGVRVRSRVPRTVSIRLPGGASETDAAVVAADVGGAELSGITIVGDAATPLGIGLLVRNADVVISDIEITGAHLTAIEIGPGAGASIIAAAIHDNPGAGLTVRSGAQSRVAHSEFVRNGKSDRAPGAIVIDAGARPQLTGNVFHGVLAESLTGLAANDRAAVRAANWFLAAEEPAVRHAQPPGRRGGR